MLVAACESLWYSSNILF